MWKPQDLALVCLLAVASAACTDSASAPLAPEVPTDTTRAFTSVRWNQRAVALVVARPPASNGQAAVSRILTYLSLAQHRAALAARGETGAARRPSVSAAVGRASAAVLASFFPLDSAAIDAQLAGDLATPVATGAPAEDQAAGEALGRTAGAAVLAQAARDEYLVKAAGTPPTTAGSWVSAAGAIVRSLHGTRPIFLTTADQLRPPAPPAVGSPQHVAALAEVRRVADTRTAQQTAIAVRWNTSSGPFTAGALNLIADSVIRAGRIPDHDAARILALANAAAFDAQIACWDAKFAYWYPRPSHADPGITLAIALPNHPSYPSGHSCMTGAVMAVLADAFPAQRAALDALVEEAGMSRLYGGIHYRFDLDAGRDIGRAAAALAVRTGLR